LTTVAIFMLHLASIVPESVGQVKLERR